MYFERGCDLVAKAVEGISAVELRWSHGEVSPLPFVEPSCFAELAQAMETRDIVTVLEALLQEQRVCLLSSDVTQLTPVCEALRNLMFPLKWQHAYIPLLPKELLGYLEAPIPFMVGLDQCYLDEDLMVAEAVDSSAAVTVRLNQKPWPLTEGAWSAAIHVPDDIGFVSMSHYVRTQLIAELEDAFVPFRSPKPKSTTPLTATATANSPSKTAVIGTTSSWRLLGGGSGGNSNQHPLSLSSAIAATQEDMRAEWRLGCQKAQRSTFHAIARVMSGYDKFVKAEEVNTEGVSAGVQEDEMDPGAFFDRDAFMCHHRHRLMKENTTMRRLSEDGAGSPLSDTVTDTVTHVAPLSAKFAENIIHTQLFEAFIEVSPFDTLYIS